MNGLEGMRIALRSLCANKLRSGLTMLGIIVGVAAVVCVVSVGAGAQEEVTEKIRTLGANLLLVMPGARAPAAARLEAGRWPTSPKMTLQPSCRQLQVVQVARPCSRARCICRRKPELDDAGRWDQRRLPGRARMADRRGRTFAADELEMVAKVAIVGTDIVDELFDGRSGVGETLRIGNVPFTIIAVLDKKGLGAAGRSQDDVVFIPLTAAKSRVLGAVRGATRQP